MISKIAFLLFFALIVYLAYKKGAFKRLKGTIPSILKDIKEGRFKYRRWHWHALGFVLGGAIQFIGMYDHDYIMSTYFDIENYNPIYAGVWLIVQVAISLFVGFCIAFGVEIYQGTKGANRTEAEVFESDKDIIVTTFFILLGIITIILIL